MLKKLNLSLALLFSVAAFAQQDSTKTKQLDEFVLNGIRASATVPVTQFNIETKQLKELYYGADLPVLFNKAPSIHSYSDNGTGIGYSFFRLRGLDQTRINVTVNGVPINDPENQGTFFNNFADLASSAQSIQIQRGVGTSTNGTAAFGGSVNVLTRNLEDKPSAELNLGFGSFNSRRMTAEVQTGKLGGKYSSYLRLSNLSTDGYRDRSGSEITSYFFSVGRTDKKSQLKLNIWGGDAQSSLAYLGADKANLAQNRKFNPLLYNEQDRFRQNFFQLQYQYKFNNFSGINASAYYVNGEAPNFQVFFGASPYLPYSFYNMPEPIVGSDTIKQTDAMVSYKLKQQYVGSFANYYYHTNKLKLDIGVHANTFSSDHFMQMQWATVLPANYNPNNYAYFNTGYKTDLSAFIKTSYNLTQKLSVFTDLQLRNTTFKYKPKTMEYAAAPFISEDMSWVFFNPKVGVNYIVNNNLSLYSMVGLTSREPTRFDYFQDDYATKDTKQSDIKHEQVTDVEIGMRYVTNKVNVQFNGYYMAFQNAIINTGELNAFGYPKTANVANSTRMGIELDATVSISKKVMLTNTSVLSSNTIKNITQYYTDSNFASVGVNYSNTAPALTPNIIINQGVRYMPFKWLFADVNYRYVSNQFMDNSGLKEAEIPAYSFVDFKLNVSLKQFIKTDANISFVANNVLNQAYYSWGSTAYGSNTATYDNNGSAKGTISPLYFVAPLRNYFVTLQVRF